MNDPTENTNPDPAAHAAADFAATDRYGDILEMTNGLVARASAEGYPNSLARQLAIAYVVDGLAQSTAAARERGGQ